MDMNAKQIEIFRAATHLLASAQGMGSVVEWRPKEIARAVEISSALWDAVEAQVSDVEMSDAETATPAR